jgi:hypothetical protein
MTQRCKNNIKVSFFWAPGRAIASRRGVIRCGF